MNKVWDGYIKKTLPLDITLKEAYGQSYNIKSKWVKTLDMTLGDYVDKCAGELEYDGYNLESTPLHVLETKFLQIEVTITAPQEYIDLTECLSDIEEQINECDAKGYNPQIKSQLFSIKEKIEERIKAIA